MRTISTSGDLNQFVELDGIRYSHVIDPRTGLGCTSGRQVTVLTGLPHGIADALATTGCLLDLQRFERMLRAIDPNGSAIVFERADSTPTVTMIGHPPVDVADVP